jgi:hypothetical protein
LFLCLASEGEDNMTIELTVPAEGGGTTGDTTTHAFTFQPGGTASTGVYTDWASLMAALDAVDHDVPHNIVFDNRYTTPCVVPAGGPYDMTNVTWLGLPGRAFAVQVVIADGASFTKLLSFARNIQVCNQSTTPLVVLENDDLISVSDNAEIGCESGASYFYDGSSLAAWQYAVFYLWNNGKIGSSDLLRNTVAISMGSTEATYLFGYIGSRGSWLGNEVVDGSAQATISVELYSDTAIMMEQTGILGTLILRNRAHHRLNQNPQRPGTPATANISDVRSGDWIKLDATGGTFTQNMPTIAATGAGTEWTDGYLCIISELSGIEGITLDGSASETINGAATYWLPPGGTVIAISDGVSNWTVVAKTRDPQTDFIFQPGGAVSPGVYTDWAALYADLSIGDYDTPRNIYFDDQFTSPCVVPAGAYDMTNVTWVGMPGRAMQVVVSIADGASFTKLLSFRQNIRVLNNATSALVTLESDDLIDISDTAEIGCTAGAAPFYSGDSLSGGTYAVVYLSNGGAIGLNDDVRNNTAISMGSAAATYLFIEIRGGRSWLGNEVITAGASSAVTVYVKDSSSIFMEQTGIQGTLDIRYMAGPQYNPNPSRGTVPATSPISDVRPSDWIKLNAAGGSFTQTAPEVAHGGAATEWSDGKTFIISEVSGVNGITIDGDGAETINGAASYFLPAGATVQMVSDGISNWTIVGVSQEAVRGEAGVWSKNQYQPPQYWTNVASGIDFVATDSFTYGYSLSNGTAQVSTPTGLQEGMGWRVTVSGDGEHNLTWDAAYDWGESGAPDLTAISAGQYRILDFYAPTNTTIAGAASEVYGS